jgi:hypothetical protein
MTSADLVVIAVFVLDRLLRHTGRHAAATR